MAVGCGGSAVLVGSGGRGVQAGSGGRAVEVGGLGSRVGRGVGRGVGTGLGVAVGVAGRRGSDVGARAGVVGTRDGATTGVRNAGRGVRRPAPEVGTAGATRGGVLVRTITVGRAGFRRPPEARAGDVAVSDALAVGVPTAGITATSVAVIVELAAATPEAGVADPVADAADVAVAVEGAGLAIGRPDCVLVANANVARGVMVCVGAREATASIPRGATLAAFARALCPASSTRSMP